MTVTESETEVTEQAGTAVAATTSQTMVAQNRALSYYIYHHLTT